jgi:hypothetical protein
MHNDEFWKQFTEGFQVAATLPDGSVHAKGKSLGDSSFRAVRQSLASKEELRSPVEAGTKVAFVATLSSIMAYDTAPSPEDEGTVVLVKTASGDVTEMDGLVFVKWASTQKIQRVYFEHLKLLKGSKRTATSHKIRVASLGDLSDFLRIGSETLVHKATQDLWSVKRDTQGYVIERLFDDDGTPLKV